MLLFSKLSVKLKKQNPEILSVCNADSLVSGMMFFGSEEERFLADIIYIIFGERAVLRKRFPNNLIVVYRNRDELETLKDHFSTTEGPLNLLLVAWENYEMTVNSLQEILQSSQRYGDRYADFLRMIVNGKDLFYLLSEGAKQCGRQLVALDISGKIQGYSTPMPYLTADWIEALSNGYCPAYFMQHLYDRLLTRTEITNQPFAYLCEETGLTYLSSPVLVDGSAEGYVFLLSETDEFDPVAYEILPILSKVLGDYLKKNSPDYGGGNQLFYSLIRDALRGETADAIESRMASLKMPMPKAMRVFSVRSYYFEQEQEMLKTLSRQLSMVFGSLAPIYYESRLILIQDLNPKLAVQNQKAVAYLQNLAETNRLHVGVSNEFFHLEELAEYFAQAEEALKLAGKLRLTKSIIYYSDMAFYSMLCKIPADEKIERFCHPSLAFLKQYDAENGTELLKTLECYVNSKCNQKVTAELLYTHQNTINYRRQQIVELTGVDFQDPDTLFQLEYSLKIYHFFNL